VQVLDGEHDAGHVEARRAEAEPFVLGDALEELASRRDLHQHVEVLYRVRVWVRVRVQVRVRVRVRVRVGVSGRVRVGGRVSPLACGHWKALYSVTTKAEVGRLARMFFSLKTT